MEHRSCFTFFWSGCGADECHVSGMSSAVRTPLIPKLLTLPKGLNDCLITLWLPLSYKKQLTVISAYAPTMNSPEEVKKKFYDDLNTLIKSMPIHDRLILLGNFNARVGTDYKTWFNVIGKNGVGKCNSNGLMLLQSCAEHGLLITSTLFHLCTHNKTSWMHPWSKHWCLIDCVITRRRDLQDVRVTKAMCCAECWTGHRLIITRLNVCIHPPHQPQSKRIPKRLNISKLKSPAVRQLLYEDLK